MKQLFMLIPLVVLCCLGCQQDEEVTAVDVEADIQAIRDTVAELDAAFQTANVDGMMPFFSDDAVRIPPNSPAAVGKDAVRAFYEQMFNEISLKLEYIIQDIQVSGDLAVAHFTISYIATPKGEQVSFESKGNEIHVWKRQVDNSWKIIYLILSDENLVYPDQAE
jgi:uncharacterized protein (TIGR02246 family)